MSSLPSNHLQEHLEVFQCPYCSGSIAVTHDVHCAECGRAYPVEDGIPRFYVPSDPESEDERDIEGLTQRVQAFYEETPFPNYEETESIEDLVAKAERGIFARMLNDQLPFNSRVLEVGCGTGQLSNFLGIAQRTLFGADMTLNSLRLANEFRTRNALDNVGFYQMNLYRPVFRPESFDVVLCSGVLCATAEPHRGFLSVAPLVKRGGYLLIGTYNTYGRLVTDIRRLMMRAFGNRWSVLDPNLRNEYLGAEKKKAWFEDQYHHPCETKQSFGEVLSWFNESGFEFVSGIPSPKAFESFRDDAEIFKRHSVGNSLDHFIVQTRLIFSGSLEGGFFIMIGQRKRSP